MTVIIAEIGVDHEGDSGRMRQLVEAAGRSGADIVKTQYYRQGLRGPNRTLPWLSENSMEDFVIYSEELGMEPLITAHDEWAIDFILNDLGMEHIKLGSGGWHLLDKIPSDIWLYISTGMHTPGEVSQLASKLRDRENKSIIMHCVSEYPCPPENAHLHNITVMQQLIHGIDNLHIGYSDHTQGMHIPLATVGMNVRTIEKHLTLERYVEGRQDTFCSLDPIDFKAFVGFVRQIDKARRIQHREITDGERGTMKWLKARE